MNMNAFLQKIVDDVPEFDAIIIFDLTLALPLYYGCKDPKMRDLLFDKENDTGVAVKGFENLRQVSEALNSFGKVTNYGSLEYSIFKLKDANLMVYFYDLPDTKVAIIFLGLRNIALIGALISSGKYHIKDIQRTIPNQ